MVISSLGFHVPNTFTSRDVRELTAQGLATDHDNLSDLINAIDDLPRAKSSKTAKPRQQGDVRTNGK